MARFCEQCGAPLVAGTRFCEQCGAPVPVEASAPAPQQAAAPQHAAAPQQAAAPRHAAQPAAAPAAAFCEQCGAALEPGFAFCMECGAPVAAPAAASAPAGGAQPQMQPQVQAQAPAAAFCEQCGAPLEPGFAFCMECGAPVAASGNGVAPAQMAAPAPATVFCEQCGAALSAGQRACHVCGAPVTAAGVQDAQAAAPSASGYYAPPQAFEPEKKQGFFSRLFKRKKRGQGLEPGVVTPPPDPAQWGVPAQPLEDSWGVSYCPQCGAQVKDWMRNCPRCGAVLDDSPDPGSTGGSGGSDNGWGKASVDDTPTSVYTPGGDDFPTTLVDETVVYAVRSSTGDRIDLVLPTVLGKGSAATCLISGNTAISRQHARIVFDGVDYVIEDLNTTNGTAVDGYQLERGGSALLSDGSVFALANEEFTFHFE